MIKRRGVMLMNSKTGWNLKSTAAMQEIVAEAQLQFPEAAEADGIAAFFKALGDETRLKIIALLSVDDLCMCEIVDGLAGATSTISHHLKIMEKGKMIKSRREGKFTIYSLDKERLAPLLPYIKEGEENV
jgi:DNA-binding transcriptional ArsR family regulator